MRLTPFNNSCCQQFSGLGWRLRRRDSLHLCLRPSRSSSNKNNKAGSYRIPCNRLVPS
ncbi:hypothetical protein DPMN_193344 [Dreissena polymorpha]|uniref:Uncharacterized protein n=1 Tax=Dreissena polymorpha TaxID=45954 RepID=A0A9D3Y345_DREPO|nr:hypothetical protein DPMN_193344 [Dreissena polymorpha]